MHHEEYKGFQIFTMPNKLGETLGLTNNAGDINFDKIFSSQKEAIEYAKAWIDGYEYNSKKAFDYEILGIGNPSYYYLENTKENAQRRAEEAINKAFPNN
jgi:hypothetical protein